MKRELYQNALVAKAFSSTKTLGRRRKETDDLIFYEFLDPYKMDAYKIKASKSFRTLAGKTQVWSLSNNPLVRNRLTHTMEVEAIAVLISEVLGLNVSLTRAIALAHDLGHAPFGHLFEGTISEIIGAEFLHENFGPIVLQKIERQGKGVNISFEVLEGILHHSLSNRKTNISSGLPLEYSVVMYADKIAYLLSDINDCLRQKYIVASQLPRHFMELGKNQREQTNTILKALFEESIDLGYVSFFYSQTAKIFNEIRGWMFRNVYVEMDQSPERIGYGEEIKQAFNFVNQYYGFNKIDSVVALATMTDRQILFLSAAFKTPSIGDIKRLEDFGITEILPFCRGVGFQKKDIDLSWAVRK